MATNYPGFESLLIVLMNGVEGRVDEFNDWYNNVHIRDCMRMPGAIAVQRFSVTPEQVTLNGARSNPHHKHLSLYEWADIRNVPYHLSEAFTEKGVISSAGDATDVLDYYFNPRVLSNGYTAHSGFRALNENVLLARFRPKSEHLGRFERWFRDEHLPSTLAMPGFVTAGLFSFAKEQMCLAPPSFDHIAVYALSDVPQAVQGWNARHAEKHTADLSGCVTDLEIGVFRDQIPRLLASEVLHPSLGQAIEELRARRSLKRQTIEAATSTGLKGYVFTNPEEQS